MDDRDLKIENPELAELSAWLLPELEVTSVKICQHCGWQQQNHFGVDLACPCADSRHLLPYPVDGPDCLADCERSPVLGHFLAAAL
jgi:hypothetical protein